MEAREKSLWQVRWRASMEDMALRSDTAYWNRRAADYDDFITTSRFDYGQKMAGHLRQEGLLGPETSVLEIASGVGAVTVPLARSARWVTALEPAEAMAALLGKNAHAEGLDTIEVIEKDFAAFSRWAADASYDLVFLCHAAWQFPDLEWLFYEMNRLSRSCCCISDTIGTGSDQHKAMRERLGIRTPELDRTLYLYNVLQETGFPANLSRIHHVMRRSEASASSMWENVVQKYRELSSDDEEIIREHVTRQSRNGIYVTPGTMSLMWWRKP